MSRGTTAQTKSSKFKQREAHECITMTSKKPPTQGIGVQGFKADLYASDAKPIRWDILIHLPKFQMFCVEQSKMPHDNVMDWIGSFVQHECSRMNPDNFLEHYVKWHDGKGYWANEDVFGNLK